MYNLPWLNAKDSREKIASLTSTHQTRHGQIKTIYLFLTRKCNLGCSHCYINGVGPKARDNDFKFETIKQIIEQALPHGLRKVKISGGEPMIHQDFMAVLQYLDELGLDEIVLETNGTLMQDEHIEVFRKMKNLTIFISLDHIDTVQHDKFRQKSGAYEKATTTLQKIGSANIHSVVTTTAYNHNYMIIPEIIDMVLSWGISKHRTLMNIHPLGNALQNTGNALTLLECIDMIQLITALDHFKNGRAYLTLPPALMPAEQLTSIKSCGWGDEVVGILSNGEVSMCSASYDDPNMIGGNVFDEKLIDIWNNSPFFTELQNLDRSKVKGVCSNCVLYENCRGVCRMSSYSHYGEKDAPYPLCQEFYNYGLFPAYALIDPSKDCTYKKTAITFNRADCGNHADKTVNRLLEIEKRLNA